MAGEMGYFIGNIDPQGFFFSMLLCLSETLLTFKTP